MPRQVRIDPERLQTLEQRATKAQRDLRRAISQQKEQLRADDARRKIIGGALCETHALANRASDFAVVYLRLLKEYVRPEDRWLFADTFRALLAQPEAESLLAQGETARLKADQERTAKKAQADALPRSPAPAVPDQVEAAE